MSFLNEYKTPLAIVAAGLTIASMSLGEQLNDSNNLLLQFLQ